MKKRHIKNVKNEVVFISLAIISSFLLIINFIPLFGGNVGITTKYTRELEIDRITHVKQSNPDMNYFEPLGKSTEIGDSCEAYFHYNLRILPKETEALHLVINHYSFESYPRPEVENIELNLILVESDWNFSEINWNNKPEHEEIIEAFNISEIQQNPWVDYYDLEKTINLTEIFKERQLSEISFCINLTENNPELDSNVYISDIRLIYNYEKFIISYTAIITSIIIFSMLIGMLYFIKKDLYSCSDCGTKRKFDNILCPSCENKITNDILIRGSYYQLLLILLWLFVFLEGCYLLWASYVMFSFIYTFMLSFLFILITPFVIVSPIMIWRSIKKYRELKQRIELRK